MDYIGIVYKIKCISNGKYYIGQTIQPLHRRWYQHKRYSKIENEKLYHAMRKYGVDMFEINTMCKCVSKEELNHREIYYIKLYDSVRNGYNTQTGGRNNFKHSKESKKKMSEARKGVKKPTGFGAKISKALIGRKQPHCVKKKISESQKGEKSAWWCRKHSKETCEKIRQANLGKIVTEKQKEAISKANKGRKWSEEVRKKMEARKTKPTKQVMNMNTGIVYDSLKEAGIKEKIDSRQIGDVCRGRRKSTHGFVFRYL